ncbi:hypothetical protein D3C73_1318890 [compost metagenome]
MRISGLFFAHGVGKFVSRSRQVENALRFGGFLQQAIEIRLQGQLRPGTGLHRHEATCTAVL